MPRIFGYGEDGLTFWALSSYLPSLFEQLKDGSDSESAVVFYRPSFGRKGRLKDYTDGQTQRAEFGEFDAIIGTPKAVYLIEAKWGARLLKIEGVQRRRHEIFRFYLHQWSALRPASWSEFTRMVEIEFQANFTGNCIAPIGSRLPANLEFVLRKLSSCGLEVHDVCVHFLPKGEKIAEKPKQLEPFQYIPVGYLPDELPALFLTL